MTTQPIFKDLNGFYGENVFGELLFNEDAIRQSIFNILMTPIGTRLFRPDYGSRIHDFIYEPKDNASAIQIENMMIQAVEKWEPRIVINPEGTFVLPSEGGFTLNLSYRIKATGANSSYTFSVIQ